ncbi:hypothetical protein DMB65_02810 [Flavobacterium cheongpyeongense]|uniref:Cell wall anchor protein n=1 Tax=Flavobacterium cheongpyeongense TaxID=2212651 RepID=A0A2V4BUB1_9FLAO|nr:hypothetical protein [Flavobacterium cheongpyeongense]PXY42182.1 hypothetical protein DMB65_02810 [Flavobacterium cheongpyeongense]
MNNSLKLTFLIFLVTFLSQAQISTGTGGASNVLPNSPTTNTNIGIGINNPTQKLEVIGNIKGTKGIFSGNEFSNQTFANWDAGIDESICFSGGTINPAYPNRRVFNMYDMSMASPYDVKLVGFNMSDRTGKERFVVNLFENSTTELVLNDAQKAEFFKVKDYGDIKGAYLQMGKPNTKVIIGGWANEPIIATHKFVVKGSSLIQGDILTDSNIGIGTYNFTDGTETYRLSVKGKIRAEEIKVYNTWADYVFNKNYKLPSLEEVETYIAANGHLQNVPSAKEVTENGLKLGEMTKIQQEKIEELTLYIIEQNKINEKQNQEIEELKNQVKALLEKKQ